MLDNIPSRLAVIGFTARNLEVASLYANLGIKVEIFEAKPVQQCIKAMDRTALNYLMKKMMSKQVEFYFQTRVVKVDKKRSSSMIKLTLQGGKLGEEEVREFSHCFIWANEVFNPSQLKLKTVNLKSTVRGIVTDKTGRTNQKNIFAFGEASAYTTEGSKLAMLNEFVRAELPKAKAQEYDSIYPIISSFSWIRSNPDILTIGMTEIEAIAKFGPQIKSKLVQLDSVEGFVKVSFKNTNEQIVSIVLAGEMAKRLNTLAFFAIERNVAVKDFLGYLKTVLA
jgi:dihydrolipoamide dehydrogenase